MTKSEFKRRVERRVALFMELSGRAKVGNEEHSDEKVMISVFAHRLARLEVLIENDMNNSDMLEED